MTRSPRRPRLASSARRNRRPAALRIESLEPRTVPTTIVEVEPNDSAITAQVVTIATGDVTTTLPADWLIIQGGVASTVDADYYRFTLASAAGVFFDIDSRETGLSASLNTVLTLFTADGSTTLGSNDNGYDFEGFAVPLTSTGGAASPDSSLYADLTAGTYVIRVTQTGSTTGNYHLRLLADGGYPASVPVFQSVPGSADTLYLDFDGHSATDSWGTYTAVPYDFNSNATQFSPAERLSIVNTWRVVSEDYSPFNINVSTATPGTIANGVGHRQVITNSSPTIVGQSAGILGVAFVGSYGGFSNNDNTAFTFAANFNTFNSSGGLSGRIVATPVEMGNTSAHEFGHALGLHHYDVSVIPNGIMSTPDQGLNREVWLTNTNVNGVTQDDMGVISNATNTFGYRADDHGNDRPSATVLSASGNTYAATGRVERTDDLDYFRFVGSGPTTVSVDVSEYVTNLDTEVRLFDANGVLVGSSAPAGSFDATLSQTLTTGTYYVEVRGTGGAGVAGQYGLRIDTSPNTPPRVTTPIPDVTVNEDAGPTVIDLGPHFEDSEDTDAQLTFSLAGHTNPALVTANLISGLSLRLTYAANASGTALIRVRATDRGGLWVEDEFLVTVLPVNDAPVAVNNSYQVDEDQQLTVNAPGVLGNDTDVEGSPLSANFETLPAHGTLQFNTNGSFTYLPHGHYHGPDAFTYRASDGLLPSNLATVSITVRPVNDAPVAQPDDLSTDEDTPLTLGAPGLLGNDADVDGDLLTAQKVSNPLHGTVVIVPNGSFAYTPAANYNGPDSFTYRVSDGTTTSSPVTVTLTVFPVNDAPVVGREHYTLDEDGSLSVDAPGLLGNDWDLEGDSVTAAKASDPLHGSVTVNADGSFSYVPLPNYFGPDSFTYEVSDGMDASEPTIVTIQVTSVNDAPAADDDTTSVPQGKSRVIAVLANDTDPEGDLLRVTTFTQGAKGRVSRVGDTLVYTPRAGVLGADQLTYTIADPSGATASATVQVNIVDTKAPQLTAVRLYFGPSGAAVVNLAALGRSVLPWAGVHRAEFTFSEDVVVSPAAISLVGEFTGAIDLVTSYDPVTRTLAVSLPGPLGLDRYTLRLSAAGVADVYTNPLSADWGKTFGVLPGDFDGNGVVDDRDLVRIRRNYSRPGRLVNRAADVNGDGWVDVQDYNAAFANRGLRLS